MEPPEMNLYELPMDGCAEILGFGPGILAGERLEISREESAELLDRFYELGLVEGAPVRMVHRGILPGHSVVVETPSGRIALGEREARFIQLTQGGIPEQNGGAQA